MSEARLSDATAIRPPDRPEATGAVLVSVIGVVATFSGIPYGFAFVVIAGAEPFLTRQFGLDSTLPGLVVSNLDLGAALGALLAGLRSERSGRRRMLLATATLFLLSFALTSQVSFSLAENTGPKIDRLFYYPVGIHGGAKERCPLSAEVCIPSRGEGAG